MIITLKFNKLYFLIYGHWWNQETIKIRILLKYLTLTLSIVHLLTYYTSKTTKSKTKCILHFVLSYFFFFMANSYEQFQKDKTTNKLNSYQSLHKAGIPNIFTGSFVINYICL